MTPRLAAAGEPHAHVDYEVLLRKMIYYFAEMEGTTYIGDLDRLSDGSGWGSFSEVRFSDAEAAVLKRMDEDDRPWNEP